MYAITSVDSALMLATLLQQEGPMRVTDAAERLGVSVSTAHRLLGMLVYRDFAEQLPDRRYGPGRLMQSAAGSHTSASRLRELARPHLQRLVQQTGETVNLMVLAGPDVYFIATVECEHILRAGDRTGRTLPAHLSSGGKAMLGQLPEAELDAVLAELDEATAVRIRRQLRSIRRGGLGINDQETESGLIAVGVAVPHREGEQRAAISLSMPTVRYDRARLGAWEVALSEAAGAIAQDLAGSER
jgi:IclR family acetate operon transcriptional repressor